MKTAKKFDCVRLKGEIQARLRERRLGKSDQEVLSEIRNELATSDDPIAKLWRSLANRPRAR